jgi:hypothetical protein
MLHRGVEPCTRARLPPPPLQQVSKLVDQRSREVALATLVSLVSATDNRCSGDALRVGPQEPVAPACKREPVPTLHKAGRLPTAA